MKGFGRHVTWFVLSLATAAITLYLLLSASGTVPSLDASYRVRAIVPTSVSLAPGSTVKIAGLQVGEVTGVTRRTGAAVLDLELDDNYAPISRDARVEVRLRTVVGENYVELYPGAVDAPALPSGGVLPMSQAVESVQIDEILSVLDEDTRARARQMIRGLGRGLDQRGDDLNAFVDEVNGEVDAGSLVLGVLARDRRQLARFVDQFGAIGRALGERRDAIRVLARQARVTAESVGSRDQSLRAMLEELPPTLVQARQTLATLRSASGTVAPALSELAGTVRKLDPVIKALRPATREGRAVLNELRGAAPRLATVLAELRKLSGPGREALPRLRSALCELNPLAAYLSPYARDLGALTTSLPSYTGFYDANGHAEREFDMFDEATLTALDEETSATAQRLLSMGALGVLHQKGYNAYPKPNEIPQRSSGHGATGPKTFKGTYPRVEAEC